MKTREIQFTQPYTHPNLGNIYIGKRAVMDARAAQREVEVNKRAVYVEEKKK